MPVTTIRIVALMNGWNRREILRQSAKGGIAALGATAVWANPRETRPNISFAISDDQSWLHVGAAGDPVVKTPVFDRMAREGARFTNT
jgi:hypothetical protein